MDDFIHNTMLKTGSMVIYLLFTKYNSIDVITIFVAFNASNSEWT